jgi:hypothetical protein
MRRRQRLNQLRRTEELRAKVPQNTSQAQTSCETKLAGNVGGPGAIMRTRYDANGIYRGEDPVAALAAVGREARWMPADYDPIGDGCAKLR